jgi:BNR/Asp-box repeat
MAGLRTGLFHSRRARGAVAGVISFALALFALSPIGGRAAGLSFTADYVSTSLAGGEPFVIYSHAGNDLVYSGHEGTTHLYNGGGVPQPGDTCDIHTAQGFVCSYNNQVNNWYSTDQGLTWTKSPGNPAYTGFSDPSLTEDAAGTSSGPLVYNTGIDLVNDALFASQDGGKTWIAGTPQCHQGDRPWLAGGKNGEVFMGTDSNVGGHVVIKGTVTFAAGVAATITCSTTTIADPAATTGTSIGDQLYYDHSGGPFTGDLVEPARFNPGDPGCPAGSGNCLGISVLPNASNADFTSTTSTSHFIAHPDPVLTSFNDALGPRIIIGSDDTIYMVWATGPTTTGTNNCGGGSGPSPVANQVLMAYTTNEGVTWSPTKLIAQMTNAVAWWPWAAAGPSGNVSIVWYQSNQVTDPDCDSAHSVLGLPSTSWTVQIANIYGVAGATYPPVATDAVPNFDTLHAGGVIHVGAICQNGTTCALNTTAGNEDRRLGDYFTNALDQNGCVMIATADTQLSDSTPVVGGGGFRTGRPLFVHQASGPSLTTGLDCATFAPNIPEVPTITALLGAGALAVGAAILVGRRRRITLA